MLSGYVGEISDEAFKRQVANAADVMEKWRRGDWEYVGVSVEIFHGYRRLAIASLWGVECNYPGAENACLNEFANDLLAEAIHDAREFLGAVKD